MAPKQLYFDLDFTPETDAPQTANGSRSHQRLGLRRGVLGWLISQGVNGLAVKTPTRLKRYHADIAGFWNQSTANSKWEGPSARLMPCQTIIIECRVDREDCWPDCTNSRELLPKLRDLKRQRQEIERKIRIDEPELRETSTLFEEYSEWHYEQSENTAYQRLRRQIEKTERALYKGSRFESMRRAGVADRLYLAVPEKTVHPHELADGWGLLWVKEDLDVHCIEEAEFRNCVPENRFHLVQNIASSAIDHVLFGHGIIHRDHSTHFVPVPRRRRVRRSNPAG